MRYGILLPSDININISQIVTEFGMLFKSRLGHKIGWAQRAAGSRFFVIHSFSGVWMLDYWIDRVECVSG
jgi:hypothetical protein